MCIRDRWRSIQDALDGNKLFAAVMKRTDMQERFAYYLEQCIQNYFTEEKVTAAIEQLKALRDQELEANIEQKKSQDPTYSMSPVSYTHLDVDKPRNLAKSVTVE